MTGKPEKLEPGDLELCRQDARNALSVADVENSIYPNEEQSIITSSQLITSQGCSSSFNYSFGNVYQ